MSQDTRLNDRYIDLRTPANQAIFAVQAAVCQVRAYFSIYTTPAIIRSQLRLAHARVLRPQRLLALQEEGRPPMVSTGLTLILNPKPYPKLQWSRLAKHTSLSEDLQGAGLSRFDTNTHLTNDLPGWPLIVRCPQGPQASRLSALGVFFQNPAQWSHLQTPSAISSQPPRACSSSGSC